MKSFAGVMIGVALAFCGTAAAQEPKTEGERWREAIDVCLSSQDDPAAMENACREALAIGEKHFPDQAHTIALPSAVMAVITAADQPAVAAQFADRALQLLSRVEHETGVTFAITAMAQYIVHVHEPDLTRQLAGYLRVLQQQQDRGVPFERPLWITNDDVELELPSRDDTQVPPLTHAYFLEDLSTWLKRDAYYLPSLRQIVFHGASSGFRSPVRFTDLQETVFSGLNEISALRIDGDGNWVVQSEGSTMHIDGETGAARLIDGVQIGVVGYSGEMAGVENGKVVQWYEGRKEVLGRPSGIPRNWTLQVISVRSDGEGISGTAYAPNGKESRAFEWWREEGFSLLPGDGAALATDDDGIRKVGYLRKRNRHHPVRWDDDPVILGDLPGGGSEGMALAIDGWGATIAGWSESGQGREAFVQEVGDRMEGLGDLPGGKFFSEAHFITEDDNVVFGVSESNRGEEVFVWHRAHGMRTLQSIIAAEGAAVEGWRLARVLAIAEDDNIIVGEGTRPDGQKAYWMIEGWSYGFD